LKSTKQISICKNYSYATQKKTGYKKLRQSYHQLQNQSGLMHAFAFQSLNHRLKIITNHFKLLTVLQWSIINCNKPKNSSVSWTILQSTVKINEHEIKKIKMENIRDGFLRIHSCIQNDDEFVIMKKIFQKVFCRNSMAN